MKLSFAFTKYLILIISCLLYFLVIYERVWPAILSEEMSIILNVAESDLGLFGSIYFWTYAIAQLIVGPVSDIIDPSYILVFSSFFISSSTIVIPFSKNYILSCFLRAFIGLGSGFIFVSVSKIFSNWFSPRGFYICQSTLLISGSLGAIIAQGPLASVLHYISWKMTFYIISSFGYLLCLLTFFFVKETPQKAGFSFLETQLIDEKKSKIENPLLPNTNIEKTLFF